MKNLQIVILLYLKVVYCIDGGDQLNLQNHDDGKEKSKKILYWTSRRIQPYINKNYEPQ